MSLTSNTPDDTPPVIEGASLPRWVTVLFVAAFALVGYFCTPPTPQRQALAKSAQEANRKTQALAAEVDKTNARIADLKGQLDVTSQKLGFDRGRAGTGARPGAEDPFTEQQKSDAQLQQQIGEVQADTTTKFGQVATQLNGTQSDLSATKADLEATKGKLQARLATWACKAD